MRVCYVIECGATGALQMVLLMAEMRRKAGDEVLIVYSRRPGAPADLRACVSEEVELAHLEMWPLPFRPLVWCWRFARLLQRWQPDVLHFHGAKAGVFGRLVAGRQPGRRAFHSPHCIPLMHLNLSGPARFLYRGLERLANAACPSVYVACTEPERRVILRNIAARTRLLENAVENGLEATVGPAPSRAGQLRRVVTCARIANLKDPDMFAEVCRAVRDVRPDVEFCWVGDGDVRHRRVLERAGVLVTGWLSREEALRTVAGGCVYLSTSRWEGMPVAVLEAMFLKVPVLCRRADWSVAIVHDGRTGRLFDDAGSAAHALLRADPMWRDAVARGAWRAARERFSEARFAAGLARIYREAAPGG